MVDGLLGSFRCDVRPANAKLLCTESPTLTYTYTYIPFHDHNGRVVAHGPERKAEHLVSPATLVADSDPDFNNHFCASHSASLVTSSPGQLSPNN
jgi:hypothetical protein